MANTILDTYLKDNTISLEKRQNVMNALKAGQSEDELASIITAKYKELNPTTSGVASTGQIPTVNAASTSQTISPYNLSSTTTSAGSRLGKTIESVEGFANIDTSRVPEGADPAFYNSLDDDGKASFAVNWAKLSPDVRAKLMPGQQEAGRNASIGTQIGQAAGQLAYTPIDYTIESAKKVGESAMKFGGGVKDAAVNLAESGWNIAQGTVTGDFGTEEEAKARIDKSTKALQDIIWGGLGVPLAPVAEVVERVPGGRPEGEKPGSYIGGFNPLYPKDAAFSLVKTPFDAVANVYKFAVKSINPNIDVDSPEFQTTVLDPLMTAEALTLMGFGGTIAKKIKQAGKVAKDQIQKVIKPDVGKIKTAEQAATKITRAKVKDIPATTKTLAKVNAKNIKTAKDLTKEINAGIKKTANQLDDHLDKFPKKYKPKQLVKTVGKTKVNYVDKALNTLDDLYGKIDDYAAQAKIQALIKKAKKEGLNVKEINNVSKEFGRMKKSFSDTTGKPLTSMNAKQVENLRNGVKQTARDLMPDDLAKALDKQMSESYTTRRYMDKVVESVNQSKAKLFARGWGEKAGGLLADALDTVSGGALKGFFRKFQARNIGSKTMNYTDLEIALPKLLKKLQQLEKVAEKGTQQSVITELSKISGVSQFLEEEDNQ